MDEQTVEITESPELNEYLDALNPEDRAASDQRYANKSAAYADFRKSLEIKTVYTKLDGIVKPEAADDGTSVELTDEEKKEAAIDNGTAINIESEIVEEKA